MITATCPKCGKSFRAPPGAVGHTARCGGCGTGFVVAAPAGSDPAQPVPLVPPPLPPGGPPDRPVLPSATVSLPVDPPPVPTLRPGPGSTRGPSAGATRPSGAGGSGAAGTSGPRSGSGPLPALPDPPPGAEVPARLGRFEVRGWVGEGMFAEVYLGYDRRLDREVALKVAKPGTVATPRRVKRFLREARAAGNLRHPNIVPLYETGEDAGRHFLVTAFVHGRTLGAAIDEARAGGRLDPRAAAVTARKLAGALGYAHSQGVVHRDLKPDNVMVDEKGEPHLMDFGLAVRPDPEDGEERLTQQGVAVGTPAYMAPEQARGDGEVGPAADQYALGCTLYELLTGRTPFAGPAQVQLLLHQTEEPARPSRHNPAVPRDLDAICLKCLAKEPKDRYPSARDVADDLDRFLRGEPVLARRQTLRYLAGKFVRRYRRGLTVAAAVLLLALVGTAAAFLTINAERANAVAALGRAEQSSREAEESSRQAAASAREAEAGFQEARAVVDDFLTELSQEGLKNVPGLQATRLKFAARAADRYDRYAALRPTDTSVLLGLARSQTALGAIKGQIGSLAEATTVLGRAIAVGERLVAENPGRPEFRLPLARARYELGLLYWVVEKHEEARPHIRECIQVLESIPELASSVPARLLLAQAYNSLGNVSKDHAPEDGRAAYLRARDIAQQLKEERPDDPECLLYLSPPIGNLASIARQSGDYTEALRLENMFLELTDQTLALLPNSPNLTINRAIGLDGKARILGAMGRGEEAVTCAREAVAIGRRVVADNPLVSRYQWLLADSLKNLADRLSSRSPESKPLLDESRKILETLVGRAEDRVVYGTALVDSWVALAEYYEYGTGDKTDPVERARLRLQALEQAVREGRRLVARYPNDREAAFGLSKALFKRGLFDTEADRHRDGYPLLAEAVESFRTWLTGAGRSPTPDQVEGVLEWSDKAQESAGVLKRADDEIRFGTIAADLGKGAATATALEHLTRVLNRAGKALEQAGRHKEAIALYSRGVAAGRPVLDRHPWHFYLRSGVTTGYKNLALACQHEKDIPGELAAWREYMRTWLGPYLGMKCDEFLRPGAPDTEDEAVRVRAFAENPPSMKRFTVPCDFNGVKYPFHIYVTDYVEPHDVIADQARWLRDVRGGTVPAEVIDSFKRLYKIAKENNVSYVDLCVYALGAAAEEGKDAGKDPKPDPKLDAQVLLREVTALKGRWEADPHDPRLDAELAAAYRKLAEAYRKQGTHPDAIAALTAAVRMVEGRAAARPDAHRPLLAELYLLLGKAHDADKDFDRAELALRRHLTLLDEARGPANPARADDGLAALAGVIFRRGQPAEAARVCAPPATRGFRPAADVLAEICEAQPAATAALPPDLRAVVELALDRAKKDKKPAGEYLAEALRGRQPTSPPGSDPSSRPAPPQAGPRDDADRHRAEADRHRAAGRRDEYRKALAAEHEARLALTAADPKAHPKWHSQKVAAELVASYLETKETDPAVTWYDRALAETSLDSLLKLGEYVEKGVNTTADPKKAERYYYFAYYRRGKQLFEDRKYEDALIDLKKLCQMSRADSEDFNLLGMCHGKLDQWADAVKAYRRAFDLGPDTAEGTGAALNLIEALVVTEQFGEAERFAADLVAKEWQVRAEGADDLDGRRALFAGLHAVARLAQGKDAADLEKAMRGHKAKAGRRIGWGWGEFDAWLKRTKLADDRKAAVGKIIAELKMP